MTRLTDHHPLTPASKHDVENAMMTMAQYERQKAAEKRQRDADRYARDMEYRLALGLPLGQDKPLPKQIGTAGGTRRPTYNGIRGTKRLGDAA